MSNVTHTKNKRIMVLVDRATIENNESFALKLTKLVHGSNFKYSRMGRNDVLVCNDGQYLLQRKIAADMRHGKPTKAVFVHGYDPDTLFARVVKESIVEVVMNEYGTLDLFVLAADAAAIESVETLLVRKRVKMFHVRTQSELQNKIHASQGDKKVVLNFESSGRHLVSCDVFVYFCFMSSDEEIRQMFPGEKVVSELMIIDTMSQKCPAEGLKFIGKSDRDIFVQPCATFFTLKNCAETGRSLFGMLYQILMTYLKFMREIPENLRVPENDVPQNDVPPQKDVPENERRRDDESDSEDDDDDDDETMDVPLRALIGKITAAFVDKSENSYLVNFFNTYIGKLENVYSTDRPWWNVTKCPRTVKMAVFIYTRSVPDFREILQFCNALRYVNNKHSTTTMTTVPLIVVVLVSSVISASALDSLRKYNAEFDWLLKMAASANCCHGTHCERTLLSQYFVDECETEDDMMDVLDVLQLVVRTIRKLESFVSTRDNSHRRVFHESEMVDLLGSNPLADDLVASFLVKRVPVTGKDGLLKVCVPFCGRRDVFVVKNDFQKYLNVSTVTGVEFGGEVARILGKLREEYEN